MSVEVAIDTLERNAMILRNYDPKNEAEMFNYYLIQVENAAEELREAFEEARESPND